jgi:hypothetical protein
MSNDKTTHQNRLDKIVAEARLQRELRELSYREQALKLFPWVCGRCAREFSRANLQELTVHHRDHNHENNPPDGSNWELLCIYCHEQEHTKYVNAGASADAKGKVKTTTIATYKPFADLGRLLGKK